MSVYATEEPLWLHKLDANERSAKLPAAVQQKISNLMKKIDSRRYPDIAAMSLRSRLAEFCGVKAEQVLVGNGSSELIGMLCAAFGGAGRPIAYPWPSFSMYPIYAAMADSPAAAIPLTNDFKVSVAAVRQALQEIRPKLLILCNPNNPTGGTIPADDLRAILMDADCPVLVDEAYYEYCGATCLSWLQEFPNLLVARTFSKAFGLAAARVGYVIASAELAAVIGKRALPYLVNSFSLAAAEICLEQRDSVLREAARTATRRDTMIDRLGRLPGIEVYPSATNFILLRLESADDLFRTFAEQKIGVRNLSHAPGLAGCLRITVGTPAENELVLRQTEEYCRRRRRSDGRSEQHGRRKA